MIVADSDVDRLRELASLEHSRLSASALRGELVGERFVVGEPIGEGGMGRVYEAVDRASGHRVAIKVVAVPDEAARARFDREAAALAELTHPGIVRYVGHGVLDTGDCWVATELLSGCVLGARLARGPIERTEVVSVVRKVAEALGAVHRLGLVHRDVKPANIFLVDERPERVVLLDFGLVRGAASVAVTRTNTVLGTASYMAPEQIRSSRDVDARADVFALGVVLFECLAGRPPFVADGTEAALLCTLSDEPPELVELVPDLDPALCDLAARMLAKSAAERPPHGDAVAAELRALEPPPARDIVGEASGASSLAVLAGKYEVEGEIGGGGMGVVLAARQRPLGRRVAIKLLRTRRLEEEARFLREARIASCLESEHATRVLDFGTLEDGAPYMVMEWLDGMDLGRWLAERGRAKPALAVSFLLQACEAVAEAHMRGIVHRDLKPSNLFLARRMDGSEIVKVLDFGISKLFVPAGAEPIAYSTLTAPTQVVGSPRYMSPEQLKTARDVDARTDVWALGALLYELLAGRPAFDAETPMALAARIASEPPDPLAPGAPEQLRAVVARCLQKDRALRYASVLDLARDLGRAGPPELRARVDRIARIVGEAPPRAPREESAADVPAERERLRPRVSVVPWVALGGLGAFAVALSLFQDGSSGATDQGTPLVATVGHAVQAMVAPTVVATEPASATASANAPPERAPEAAIALDAQPAPRPDRRSPRASGSIGAGAGTGARPTAKPAAPAVSSSRAEHAATADPTDPLLDRR